MSSERNILKRLLEGVEPEYAPDGKGRKDLEEASFEANGKIFKAAFGHYSCDGEPISREDYFAAKEGGYTARASKTPKAPASRNKAAGLFKGMDFKTVTGESLSSFGTDDSNWDDEYYEMLATYNGAAKGLGCSADDIASVTEEDDLYKHLNYIAQEGGWKREDVSHGYDNIDTAKFTDPKTGASFTRSDNGMGYQTFEVDTKKAFDPKSYTKGVDLEDYMY